MSHILYSFRRCPYAMRARMALYAAGINVIIREIKLSDKPASLLKISPKGTVPVLQLESGQVIDESLEIMIWALTQSDPNNLLKNCNPEQWKHLINENDTKFKLFLDKYKYTDSSDLEMISKYRNKSDFFLNILEQKLTDNKFLMGETISIADIAIFPFIRQFAAVDDDWFAKSSYTKINNWRECFVNSDLFQAIMHKYPIWQEGEDEVYLMQ